MFIILQYLLVLICLSVYIYYAVKIEKGRKEHIAAMREHKETMERHTNSNERLRDVIKEYNQRKKLETWNIKLLRQEVINLVKVKGGTW